MLPQSTRSASLETSGADRRECPLCPLPTCKQSAIQYAYFTSVHGEADVIAGAHDVVGTGQAVFSEQSVLRLQAASQRSG